MTPLQKAAQAAIDILELGDPLSCEREAADDLQKALDAEIAQAVEPYAVFHGLVDSGEHGAFNLDLLKMIPRGAYLYLHPPQPQATTPAVLKRLSDEAKRGLVGAWFSEDWAQKAAYGMLDDFETAQGEKP